MKRRYGFTLIELLIVIALISILAAILFPVFGRVRAKARQSVCASNLHQIGAAAGLYRTDFDDHFALAVMPSMRCNPDVWAPDYSYLDLSRTEIFPNILAPYHHSNEIFHCPSDYGPEVACMPVAPTRFASQGISYSVNIWVGSKYQTEAALDFPGEVFYLGDSHTDWHTFPGAGPDFQLGNAMFVDGHVRFKAPFDWGLLIP